MNPASDKIIKLYLEFNHSYFTTKSIEKVLGCSATIRPQCILPRLTNRQHAGKMAG